MRGSTSHQGEGGYRIPEVEPCIGSCLLPSLLLEVFLSFNTNISKFQFNTDYGRKRAPFWNSRQSCSSSQFILSFTFIIRGMKGREEGCKGRAGCLPPTCGLSSKPREVPMSQSSTLACHLTVSDTQGLELLRNILAEG